MEQHLIASLNRKYLGKWCIIKALKMDNTIVDLGGTINYIGSNEILGWDFQIVMGRTPLNLKKLIKIQEYIDEKI